MKFALFYHTIRSDWNHGNAHFLRGMVRALQARGHEVTVFEPEHGWSVTELVEDQGEGALQAFSTRFPDICWQTYLEDELDLELVLDGVDVVIVHEWTEPELVATIGRYRRRHTGVRVLFHDTHHRMVSDPESMASIDLDGYDGVLAFGAVLADAYQRAGWAGDVHTWHEAADVSTFYPRAAPPNFDGDVVWIGNWGDGEREHELMEYLVAPVKQLGARLSVYGVRYPEAALGALRRVGAQYHGWIPGPLVAEAFARFRLTVHVPRRFYREQLVGIPTIRMFEALACGIPLVAAPWQDVEGLFTAGDDYLLARDARMMTEHVRRLLAEPRECERLAANAVATIRARHTCDHRAAELEAIVEDFDAPALPERVSL